MPKTETPTADRHLDVRPVAPKHRFEQIMGAYHDLASGETLELAVDHDPSCMYYTLEAEEGKERFAFEYLEEGPETWRVHVTKKATSPSEHR